MNRNFEFKIGDRVFQERTAEKKLSWKLSGKITKHGTISSYVEYVGSNLSKMNSPRVNKKLTLVSRKML